MNKKLISLFAASAMIATASVGLVQTAYAVDPNVRIEVADGATATQKILTFYYDCDLGLNSLQGTLTFSNDEVTIDSVAITIGAKYTGADKDSGVFYFAEEEDGGASSADGSFATATITIPENADVTAYFEVEAFEDADFEPHDEEIGTVSAVVSVVPPTPAEREFNAALDGSQAFSTDDNYDKDMVVGQYTLTIKNGSYDLANAKYGSNNSKAITDAAGNAVASTVITGAPEASAIVFVVIEGTDDVTDLGNVVFE